MENKESGAAKRKSKIGRKTLFGLLVFAIPFFIFDTVKEFEFFDQFFTPKIKLEKLDAFDLPQPTLKYGFALDTFQVFNDTIQNNQFLADILLNHKVSYIAIDQIAKLTKDSFDVRNLRADKPYTILSRDTSLGADYFIYEPDDFRYVVYDLKNPGKVSIEYYPIDVNIKTASGVIKSSLWEAMVQNGMSFELAVKMEEVFAWSVDFHHIQKEDKFKLIYEEKSIDGKAVGVGTILGAYFKNFDNEYHAIYFENDRHWGYYDLEARSMEKAFLKSPVKYSRISSKFNRNRFHPVLKRRKAHLGTDYAAPYGTPILAVADGIVTKASRSRGNGNYVKLKHDNTYQTQYLHMQRFAKGIRPGAHVKQGQTIGYVGSTGLATGPHVCFRFWKNGRQVNHLRENLPPPEPMPKSDIPVFLTIKDSILTELNKVNFPALKEDIAEAPMSRDSTLSGP